MGYNIQINIYANGVFFISKDKKTIAFINGDRLVLKTKNKKLNVIHGFIIGGFS